MAGHLPGGECQLAEGNAREARTAIQEPSETETLTSKPNEDSLGAKKEIPVAFIGELKLTVNPSGQGVISGLVAGSEDDTILTFADEPVTGSYSIDANCRGTATITPKGHSDNALQFRGCGLREGSAGR